MKFYKVSQCDEGGESIYGFFRDKEKAQLCADAANAKSKWKYSLLDVEECQFEDEDE